MATRVPNDRALRGERDGEEPSPPALVSSILLAAPLFASLEPSQIALVEAAARPIRKGRSAVFFRQGEPAENLYLVLDGAVKIGQVTVEGQSVALRYARAGDVFGCVALFGAQTYPATATAVKRCDALVWSRREVERLISLVPRIASNALSILGDELATVRARYLELATERVERRIARALLRLVSPSSLRASESVRIELPLSRQDLAELAGTTLHTVSRVLSAWEHRGLVESGRLRVTIRSPRDLLRIAEAVEA